MTRLLITTAAAMLIGSAAMADTPPHGATVTTSQDCSHADATRTCTRTTTTTLNNGHTGTIIRQTTTTAGVTSVHVTGTRPSGRPIDRTMTVTH